MPALLIIILYLIEVLIASTIHEVGHFLQHGALGNLDHTWRDVSVLFYFKMIIHFIPQLILFGIFAHYSLWHNSILRIALLNLLSFLIIGCIFSYLVGDFKDLVFRLAFLYSALAAFISPFVLKHLFFGKQLIDKASRDLLEVYTFKTP